MFGYGMAVERCPLRHRLGVVEVTSSIMEDNIMEGNIMEGNNTMMDSSNIMDSSITGNSSTIRKGNSSSKSRNQIWPESWSTNWSRSWGRVALSCDLIGWGRVDALTIKILVTMLRAPRVIIPVHIRISICESILLAALLVQPWSVRVPLLHSPPLDQAIVVAIIITTR